MQLVVMATVLAAVAGAGQGCSFDCRPTNVRIPVESCGSTEYIDTTVCAGQCYNKDPVYISKEGPDKQNSCNGDWSYEVKHINGCPVAVTYPVARHCHCSICNLDDTDCSPFPGDIPGCLTTLHSLSLSTLD
ncbi:follitropin subunit beta [Hippoglossus hippoglossus]|uniref:FSH-beta protein n=1 Tax=Hippoglossus hippoglossus TaxID=8267 RepID=Q90W20_HIPHI|nr:follitropin subunit beta [Hippoglossus hippoglossus]XP_034437101.1 follitropin subunit beta [Hippoglossus hippoglossus]XP_035007250.1 follitropin subunit beta [Hippoglossus stenolepis]CAD10501.1 FSH-beta protein [Hippoglossus hippoglossus]